MSPTVATYRSPLRASFRASRSFYRRRLVAPAEADCTRPTEDSRSKYQGIHASGEQATVPHRAGGVERPQPLADVCRSSSGHTRYGTTVLMISVVSVCLTPAMFTRSM